MRLTCCLLLVLGLLNGSTLASAAKDAQPLFKKKLTKDQQALHALDRLTFGPKPGELAEVKRLGVRKWVAQQLHPDTIPENPVLLRRLEPLETLRMSALDITHRYPRMDGVAWVFTGRGPFFDDVPTRALIQRYAQYYRPNSQGKEMNSINDLEPKVKIDSLLTPAQLTTLQKGKPDEKRAVLATFPADQLDLYVIGMPVSLRNQLLAVAPPLIRRRILMLQSPQGLLTYDLWEGKLDRAIYSNRQLNEQLVDFWYNHFNVYLNKGNDRYLVPMYEEQAIRPHALGKFKDLLLATAESPAMLYYLDNFQSVAPPAQPKKGAPGLNENYGRELLELHTLGVDGGYTQQDVREVARCFTGWTLEGPQKGSVFRYNDKVHDKGEKTVLGVKVPAGGGQEDGFKVLDILVHHPSTARFVSRKLAQRFVADNPPPALIEKMAQTFQKSDGDIRAVMTVMLNSKEFWSQGAFHAKLKSPLEMIASAARALDAQIDYGYGLAQQIATLGEPLYSKVEPTGYANTSDEWINSGSLLGRMNFALRFTQNQMTGVKVDTARFQDYVKTNPQQIAREILFREPSVQTQQAIAKAVERTPKTTSAQLAALVLGSPEFQRR